MGATVRGETGVFHDSAADFELEGNPRAFGRLAGRALRDSLGRVARRMPGSPGRAEEIASGERIEGPADQRVSRYPGRREPRGRAGNALAAGEDPQSRHLAADR